MWQKSELLWDSTRIKTMLPAFFFYQLYFSIDTRTDDNKWLKVFHSFFLHLYFCFLSTTINFRLGNSVFFLSLCAKMSNNYLSAPRGRSQRVEMPPWFICSEVGLVMREIRLQIDSLILETFFNDENNPLIWANEVHINVDDELPVCAKVSTHHQNTLTSKKWSLRTNMQQFHHEVLWFSIARSPKQTDSLQVLRSCGC